MRDQADRDFASTSDSYPSVSILMISNPGKKLRKFLVDERMQISSLHLQLEGVPVQPFAHSLESPAVAITRNRSTRNSISASSGVAANISGMMFVFSAFNSEFFFSTGKT